MTTILSFLFFQVPDYTTRLDKILFRTKNVQKNKTLGLYLFIIRSICPHTRMMLSYFHTYPFLISWIPERLTIKKLKITTKH